MTSLSSSSSIVSSAFLKRVLLADAAVSGAVAVLQLAASDQLASLTGLPVPLLLGTGTFLVAYVSLLLVLAARQSVRAPLLWLVISGNLAWAVGALGVSLTQPLSVLGHAFAVVHAVAVTAFAYLEYKGISTSAAQA